MAPEMLADPDKRRYEKSVDWWSLGILLYEMMYGVTPFFNRSIYKCKDNIRKPFKTPSWPAKEYSKDFKDLVSKLL